MYNLPKPFSILNIYVYLIWLNLYVATISKDICNADFVIDSHCSLCVQPQPTEIYKMNIFEDNVYVYTFIGRHMYV